MNSIAVVASELELVPLGARRPPINLASGTLTITLVAACSSV
jgi:hypothetical protein